MWQLVERLIARQYTISHKDDSMRRWLVILLFLSGPLVYSQNTPTVGVLPDNGPSLPTTCIIGQIYFRTATTIGLNQCNPANTWTALATGAGSGTVSVNNGIAGANAYYAAAGGSTTVSPSSGLSYDAVGNATLAQGTITVSTPAFSHTGTWNAAGVAFTNWFSNITCTAAAANSIAAGLGVAGTTWQFKYNAANCASPQFAVPAGTTSNPAILIGTGVGIYSTGANVGELNVGGNPIMLWAANQARLGNAMGWGWSSNVDPTVAAFDTILSRSAAGVVSFDTTAIGNGLGSAKAQLYTTTSNCAATGTAANPSVASCSAASAGSFSCATNASTGTCTVNTTAVTANSEIFITGRNDTTTGTRLGVTCNTGITTAIPEISAVVAATSFTINLGTFTTNPECFSYFIVN